MRSLFAALALLVATPALAQVDASVIPDDAPEWKPLATAVADAKAGDKTIVLHGYAAWCGWCSRLDNDTYTDDRVQAYLAEHFEGARLDIEDPTTVEFYDFTLPMAWLAAGIGVSSTPTTVFVDGASGEIITRLPGYADAETFLLALQFVHEEAYDEMSFQAFRESRAPSDPDEETDDAPAGPPMLPSAGG